MLGWSEAASLIYDFQLLSYVIVETIEANQKCWNTRRKGENARLGKGVWLQQSICVSTDLVLLFLTAAIQRRQVEIGRCLHSRPVLFVGMKDIVDNDGSQVEKHAGDFVWVLLWGVSTFVDGFENDSWIRKRSWLQCLW